jgi:hypothetical protein
MPLNMMPLFNCLSEFGSIILHTQEVLCSSNGLSRPIMGTLADKIKPYLICLTCCKHISSLNHENTMCCYTFKRLCLIKAAQCCPTLQRTLASCCCIRIRPMTDPKIAMYCGVKNSEKKWRTRWKSNLFTCIETRLQSQENYSTVLQLMWWLVSFMRKIGGCSKPWACILQIQPATRASMKPPLQWWWELATSMQPALHLMQAEQQGHRPLVALELCPTLLRQRE